MREKNNKQMKSRTSKNLRNDIKGNKAITLVALVVTIIVLIILAAVSINLVFGNNGIMEKARAGRNNYLFAANEEIVELAALEEQINRNINGSSGNPEGEDDQLDTTGDVRITGFSIAGTPVTNVPLPSSDFEKVAGTEIGNSYVAKGKAGTDYANDEFVWVPVDKNQQLKVKIEGSGNITSVVLTNPVGDTKIIASNITAPQELTGITPIVNGNVWNGMYKVEVTIDGGEKISKYLSVHSLYAMSIENDWWYYGENATDDELFNKGWRGEYEDYSDPNDNFASRVEENGGFWIAKYEATYKNGKPASIESTATRTESTTELKNGMLWNCISRANALTTANSYNISLNSSLPTGAAWDRTMGWLYETRNKDIDELAMDSKGWGNYSDDTFSGTSSLINTGSKTQTMANNIYDLAGNLEEWSTECCVVEGTTYAIGRGGVYNVASNRFSATDGIDEYDEAFNYIGFRLVLYK